MELSQPEANPRGGRFMYASSSMATASTTATTTPTTVLVAPPTTASLSIYSGSNPKASTFPYLHPSKSEASSSSSSYLYPLPRPTDVDAMKARIISHPHYSNLLNAYMDCQKVGAPPEVADRLSAVARDFEARQRAGMGCRDQPADPELDQFMEAYYHMLVKYREELTRPMQEAMDFLRRVESQFNSLTNGSFRILSGKPPLILVKFVILPGS
ncbi:putative homeotic protein knotted-1 [Cocos nucifera]|uniref:Putative homeotic protein knotted-1 n=1 Tax=Cocos nucifera TaxID=13894 RepID=A0A8K0N146_COCNU|nr:putative homeotic protein knotted-1 [Cocos nucifera]